MVNLFDIMRQAQRGGVYENLGRQFGLSVADAQRAAEALLPAFSLGLQRTGANPSTFANVLGMMSSGRFAPYYDGAFGEFWPQAKTSGHDVLGQLFGGPESIQRIVNQAALASGVGAPILQQMMPAMASVLMGGLFRTLSVEGFAEFLRQWADWLSAARFSSPPPSRSSRAADPFAPWIDMMSAFVGRPAPGHVARGARPVTRPVRQEPASPSQGDIWTDMYKAWTDAQRPEPPPPPPPPPPPALPNPFEALSQMLQTGRDVQAQQMAGVKSAFDSLWGAAKTR